MKLLFVIGSLQGGGAEGVMCTLANEMAARGNQVTLVVEELKSAYSLSEKVHLIEGTDWEYDTFVGPLPARIYKKIANRFLDYKHLRRIIKAEKPDLVMSFLAQWLTFLVMICKGRIPLIFADRNAAVYKFGRFNFYIRNILFRFADVVQVMSYHDAAFLCKKYRKVVPMPNPLRFTPLTAEEYESGFEKRKNILAVGRLDPQKGFDKLILAFAMVAEKYPDWKVDICGEDMVRKRYSEVLKELVADYHLEDRVNFMGFHKDVDKVMREHSIFCLSSKHEGFPNVLSEAMANGMACLSFDIVTGPHEIIMDGLDGLIVENQKVDALAEGLEIMMKDKELRHSYGRHAIENIRRYNRDKVVDKWEKLFNITIKDFNHEKN